MYILKLMKLHKIYIFLSMCACTLAICKFSRDVNHDNRFTITCENTSSEDYAYDIAKLAHSQEYSGRLTQLNIAYSDFPDVKDLFSPIYATNLVLDLDFAVKISLCHVITVSEDAFVNSTHLSNFDASDNEIEDTGFLFYLPLSIKNLNLKNNKITYMDFRAFNHPLQSLDLSFNKLEEIDFSSYQGFDIIMDFPVKHFLNLDNNNISIVNIALPLRGTDDLVVNLANNPLKRIDCEQSNLDDTHIYSSIRLLNVSNSLMNLPMKNITRCKLKFDNLILSHNMLTLDSNLDVASLNIEGLDFSNSALSDIPRSIFQNKYFNSLDLSYNSLEHLNDPVFSGTQIRDVLDLSNCKIKNVDTIFQNLNAHSLNLTANSISELNSNSFNKVKAIFILDLSFNNLKLKNDSFINIRNVSILKLNNSNITLIEEGAFNKLDSLKTLHLENNYLKILPTYVFTPLLGINEIYLQSNQLTIIQSRLFSDISLRIVKLSDNKIKLIEFIAFYYLGKIESIELTNNKASLKIKQGAFYELYSLKKVNLSNSGLRTANLKMFTKTPNIQIIDLKDNNITSINFLKLNELDAIEELHLTLVGDIKSKSFLELTFLKNLTCWDCKIKTIERRAFQGLFNLKSLQLINSKISTMEDGALDGLFRLEYLYLENIKYNATATLGSLMFQDLTTLTNLNLSYKGLEDISSNSFKGLRNLLNLYLNNNNLSHFKNSTFAGLCALKVLDVSYNRLTVLEIGYFKGLDGLTFLNLSNNNLNALELGVFQRFPDLESLILRENNLSEFKMGTFSNLYKLKTLDLAQNSISDLLLESFLPLKSLSHLNLEFNNLKTFGQYSFVSNLKDLRSIGIAKNKWNCEYLGNMLVTFRNNIIDYSSRNVNFYDDNIEGIECIDICKYLLCLKDSHGIN